MDQVNMETSLHSITDPELSSLHQVGQSSTDIQDSHISAASLQAGDLPQPPLSDTPSTPQGRTGRNGGERKRKVICPGSAADFRRKEANRLAADRSRSRATEKRATLEQASANLTEENEKLRAEISRLQHLSPDNVSNTVTPQNEANTTPAIGVGLGQLSSEAQDSHSRTILAALMSAGQDNFADDDAWIQGVEDMFKEAESSGRLSELAALATVRPGPAEGGQEAGDGVPHDDTQSMDGGVLSATPNLEEGQTEDAPPGLSRTEGTDAQNRLPNADPMIPRKIDYKPEEAMAKMTAGLAVLLNAEIEKVLRDNLATTKAIHTRVNKELTERREAGSEGKGPLTSLEDHTEEYSYRGSERKEILPNALLSMDIESLKTEIASYKQQNVELEEQKPGLQHTLASLKAEKVEVETRLAAAVTEILALSVGSSPQVSNRVVRFLRGITGIVGEMINGPYAKDGRGVHSGNANFSSPAIARRKRGRPPKPFNLSLDAEGQEEGLPSSGLSHSITAEDVAAAAAAVAEAEAEGSSSHLDGDAAQHSGIHDQESIAPTPEQYILSHLQDSSNFSDFYPSQIEEMEPRLRSMSQNGQSSPFNPVDEGMTSADSGKGGNPAEAERLSVMSRWKKGGPGGCDICSRTQTSAWRKLTFNGEDLKVCNACGLYYNKFKVIRPSELWGDGKSLKKRKVVQRIRSNAEGSDSSNKKRKRGKGAKDDSAHDGEDDTGHVEQGEGEGNEGIEEIGEEIVIIDGGGDDQEEGREVRGLEGEGPSLQHQGDTMGDDQVGFEGIDGNMATVLGISG